MGVYKRSFGIDNAENKHYIVFEGVSSYVELHIKNESDSIRRKLMEKYLIADFNEYDEIDKK